MEFKSYLRMAVYAVIIGLFNLCFFMLGGTDHSEAVWWAYGFVHLAIIVSFVAPVFCINYKRIPENIFLIYVFAWIYTAIAVAFNGLLIVSKSDDLVLCIIVNAILFAAYFIQFAFNLKASHKIEKNIETMEAERQFVRDISAKLKQCMVLSKTDETRRVIEKAYDVVRTSPVKSNTQVIDYEVEVVRLADVLESFLDDDASDEIPAVVEKIIQATKKRNTLL